MYLKWIFAVVVLLSSLTIVAITFRSSRRLFFARESRLVKYIVSSALYGTSVCLLLLGIILTIGALDASYEWTMKELISVVVLCLITGLLATVGALWQYHVAGKLRECVYQWLKKNPHS